MISDICQQALTIQYKLSLISEICQQALTVQQTAPLTEMGMVRTAQSVWTRQRQTVGSTPRDSPQRCHRWTKTPRGRRKVSDVSVTIYKIKLVFILCLNISFFTRVSVSIIYLTYRHVWLFDCFTWVYLVLNNLYEFHHFEICVRIRIRGGSIFMVFMSSPPNWKPTHPWN